MNTSYLYNVAKKIEKKQNSIFTYPLEKQKKYVDHFPEPKDGFDRGYFQYCCQMKLNGKPLHVLLNIAALPLSLFYMIRFSRDAEADESFNAVFFNEGKPFNIIPDKILEEYKNIKTILSADTCLSKEDKRFLRKIFKKHPFSWMLWLKLILKVAQYSSAITKYSPDAIISCNEFSFTSPILTEYCHFRGVKLINVMHGEKLYYMRDSFIKFDEFYVWSQQYADLLCSLRADNAQFKIEVPRSLKIGKQDELLEKYDFTYYLGDESKEELARICESLNILKNDGYRVSIRPHPRYSDMEEINRIFELIDIEDTAEISIEKSLQQTKNVVSLYSTVLVQAYSSGINIVIDDISASEKYSKLEELGYVMIKVEHKLMSKLLEESGTN